MVFPNPTSSRLAVIVSAMVWAKVVANSSCSNSANIRSEHQLEEEREGDISKEILRLKQNADYSRNRLQKQRTNLAVLHRLRHLLLPPPRT